ncbi:MAG: hypothetical protein ACT4PT_08190 [Methanobacteriota archaeon]
MVPPEANANQTDDRSTNIADMLVFEETRARILADLVADDPHVEWARLFLAANADNVVGDLGAAPSARENRVHEKLLRSAFAEAERMVGKALGGVGRAAFKNVLAAENREFLERVLAARVAAHLAGAGKEDGASGAAPPHGTDLVSLAADVERVLAARGRSRDGADVMVA